MFQNNHSEQLSDCCLTLDEHFSATFLYIILHNQGNVSTHSQQCLNTINAMFQHNQPIFHHNNVPTQSQQFSYIKQCFNTDSHSNVPTRSKQCFNLITTMFQHNQSNVPTQSQKCSHIIKAVFPHNQINVSTQSKQYFKQNQNNVPTQSQ